MMGTLEEEAAPASEFRQWWFKGLGMDPGNYRGIISDMSTFVREKEFYKKAGKDWKRAYLLYNPPPPPGTSSTDRIIAAMANYLKFDIFHLDLTSLSSISDLANALASPGDRSLIAINDFHHWAAPNFKNNELMLSGLLGIIDEFLSSCGDERIIVLTTDPNHGDRVDAALMRRFGKDIYIDTSSPRPIDLPDGGEIVQLDSSEQETLVDFDATNNGEYQSGVLVSTLEKENTREASKRLCMTKSALSLVDSSTKISLADFDATDNKAYLVRACQSGPITFKSEKKDTSGGLKGECLAMSGLSLDRFNETNIVAGFSTREITRSAKSDPTQMNKE